MAIRQLTTANTFGQWLSATTQLISLSNSLQDNGVFNTNSTIIVSGSGVLNVHGTALVNTLNANTINTRTINVSGSGVSVNVRDSVFIGRDANVVGELTTFSLVVRGPTTQQIVNFGNIESTGFANVANYINVGAFLRQTSGQTSILQGRVNLTNTEISLAASGNVIVSKNVSVAQNVWVGGNLVSNRITANVGNIISFNTVSMNAESISVSNTINVANLIVTNNVTIQNLTVLGPIITSDTSNISPGNISVTNLVNTRNLIVRGAVLSDLNIQGNVRIITTRNLSPGSLGLGQFTVAGTNYTGFISLDAAAMRVGHNVSNRNLSLEVNSTPVINANTTHVNVTGDLNVSGTLSGNALGLTNVNWIHQVRQETDVQIAAPATPTPSWISGFSSTVSVPAGIDTVDIGIFLEIFIKSIWDGNVNGTELLFAGGSVSGTTSISGSFGSTGGSGTFSGTYSAGGTSGLLLNSEGGFGPGAPDLRYRVLRNGTQFYISDWTQLSLPGSFSFFTNMVRDTAPVATLNAPATNTYVIEFQWRNAAQNPDATAGTVSLPNGSRYVTGVGTNFLATLGTRAQIKIPATGTPSQTFDILQIFGPTSMELRQLSSYAFSGASYAITDDKTKPDVLLRGATVNFTGYRT